MAKIIVNMGIKPGVNATIIAEAEGMKSTIKEIKEAVKALSGDLSEDDELYKIIKVEK